VIHCRCGPGAFWCGRADAMFAVSGMHVLDVEVDDQRLVVTVESDQLEAAAPCVACWPSGTDGGFMWRMTRPVSTRSRSCGGGKRIWRCREPLCATDTFSETHDLAPPRAVLTTRAVRWAVDALSQDDTTVSALARHLGVDWHTAWTAIEAEAKVRVGKPDRLHNVTVLGVDEHIVRHEALLFRMEVGDLRRFAVVAVG
jgi:transposase